VLLDTPFHLRHTLLNLNHALTPHPTVVNDDDARTIGSARAMPVQEPEKPRKHARVREAVAESATSVRARDCRF
jgi:hypothetical protein